MKRNSVQTGWSRRSCSHRQNIREAAPTLTVHCQHSVYRQRWMDEGLEDTTTPSLDLRTTTDCHQECLLHKTIFSSFSSLFRRPLSSALRDIYFFFFCIAFTVVGKSFWTPCAFVTCCFICRGSVFNLQVQCISVH